MVYPLVVTTPWFAAAQEVVSSSASSVGVEDTGAGPSLHEGPWWRRKLRVANTALRGWIRAEALSLFHLSFPIVSLVFSVVSLSFTLCTPSLPHSLPPSLPSSLTHSLTPSLPPSLHPSLPPSLTPYLPHSLPPSLPPSYLFCNLSVCRF